MNNEKIKPEISVIMSVYNEEEYIGQALNSLLMQTEENFEVIIIDDASTDSTTDIISSIQDDRIKLFKNKENCGLTKNLNKALSLSKGIYIARMDGDDISMPRRFETQLEYMDEHRDVMLISCNVMCFQNDYIGRVRLNKCKEKSLRASLLLYNPLPHPGYFFRRELYDKYGVLYDESFISAQDYDFCERVAERFKIGLTDDVLLLYRIHNKQISESCKKEQFENANRVRRRCLKKINIELTDKEKDVYVKFAIMSRNMQAYDYKLTVKIIEQMIRGNNQAAVYDRNDLNQVLWIHFWTWILTSKNIKGVLYVLLLYPTKSGMLIRTLITKMVYRFIEGKKGQEIKFEIEKGNVAYGG